MTDYLVQEDGTSKFVLEDSSGDILLETSTASITPGFISSTTTLYASRFNAQIVQDFIGSVTAVYDPIASKPVFFDPISEHFLGNVLEYENGLGQGYDDFTLEDLPDIDIGAPFIGSVTQVFAPTAEGTTVEPSFISSVTTLYAPTIGFSGAVTTVSVAGTYTWICPPGVTTAYIECYGGGGGGGGGATKEADGGGGGAYANRTAMPVTPGTIYTFTVGAAGSGGASSSDGTAGGDTTFTGDSGTQAIAKGGSGGLRGSLAGSGGAGGSAASSTGDTKFSGGKGGGGGGFSGSSGGGGASGNPLANGAAGQDGAPSGGGVGGVGANGGGSGGDGNVNPPTAGHSPGGGGGGGEATNGTGANGADGQVVITVGVIAPFIASVTIVYAAEIADVIYPPFIASVTVVYTPTLPEIFAPFISSRTHVWPIFSLFDPNRIFSGPGNGGEGFLIRLNANGVTSTATLASNLGLGTGAILSLTGDSAFPTTRPFIVTIDDEQIYISQISAGNYFVRARARGNTTAATHTAGATVSWGDSYDQALVATQDINHNFTADINSTGSFIYPGWLICFDSSQAYLDDGSRYPMHVSQVMGVFDAGAGVSGSSRTDGPQPNAICTPIGASDDCPAALANPARIATDIVTGDVAVLRYTNPEAVVLDLGPRSASLQSWFGLKRVNSSDVDVTLTDPDGYVVDTHPSGPGPGPFTGSVNGEWDPAPLVTGIAPAASIADPANAPISTPNAVPWTTVTLPGTDRYFTYGSPGYNEQGWPMCCLTVRQGRRRVPFWQSWDWHDFSYVYSGFAVDANYAQILINRNGVLFNSVPEVELPGPQDIDGPDAVWDDGSYAFGASWYVVIFSTPYIVGGPPIGGSITLSGGETIPTVSWPGGGGSPPVFGGGSTPQDPIEGGSGGNIGGSEGLHVWQIS